MGRNGIPRGPGIRPQTPFWHTGGRTTDKTTPRLFVACQGSSESGGFSGISSLRLRHDSAAADGSLIGRNTEERLIGRPLRLELVRWRLRRQSRRRSRPCVCSSEKGLPLQGTHAAPSSASQSRCKPSGAEPPARRGVPGAGPGSRATAGWRPGARRGWRSARSSTSTDSRTIPSLAAAKVHAPERDTVAKLSRHVVPDAGDASCPCGDLPVLAAKPRLPGRTTCLWEPIRAGGARALLHHVPLLKQHFDVALGSSRAHTKIIRKA